MLIQNQIKRSDMISCLLCMDAPCSKACDSFNPGDALRSIWFDNEDVASLKIPEDNPCVNCSAHVREFALVIRKCQLRH